MQDNSYTTEELAAMLDQVQTLSGSNVEYLPPLDHMARRLAYAYPQLEPAWRNFSAARTNTRGASDSSKQWRELKWYAAELAIMVRTLGNISLSLCPKRTQHGKCLVPLTPAGECRGVLPHKR